MKARICWTKKEEGGREVPPIGPRYVTLARFKDTELDWSLVVEFDNPPDDSLCHITDIRFLVDEAPKELLYSGSEFELREGRKLVARGEVL